MQHLIVIRTVKLGFHHITTRNINNLLRSRPRRLHKHNNIKTVIRRRRPHANTHLHQLTGHRHTRISRQRRNNTVDRRAHSPLQHPHGQFRQRTQRRFHSFGNLRYMALIASTGRRGRHLPHHHRNITFNHRFIRRALGHRAPLHDPATA